jgi:hypothetical protein
MKHLAKTESVDYRLTRLYHRWGRQTMEMSDDHPPIKQRSVKADHRFRGF